MREAVSDVGVDWALALDDFVYAPDRNADVFGQVPDAYSAGREELL